MASIDKAKELLGYNPKFSIEQGLEALLRKPTQEPIPKNWTGPYMVKEPIDPWGNPYKYIYPTLYMSISLSVHQFIGSSF